MTNLCKDTVYTLNQKKLSKVMGILQEMRIMVLITGQDYNYVNIVQLKFVSSSRLEALAILQLGRFGYKYTK